MNREHLIGIDEGTTGVRALVVRPDGRILGQAYREVQQSFPHPGWHEQSPQDLWDSTHAVVAQALAAARLQPGDVAAVGITNQRGTAVLFRGDRETGDAALGPALTWQDRRTTERCRELNARGLPVNVLTASTKFEWLLERHGGGVPRGVLRLGTVDTWLTHCLSGGASYATDHSNACATGLYDYLGASHDHSLASALGLGGIGLPDLVDTSCIVGETTVAAFGARVPIASLSGDQHAASYALACLEPGALKLSLGTSAMVDLNVGDALAMPPPGAYPLVLWSLDGQRTFCLEGTVVTAGAAVQWLRDSLGLISSASEVEPLARSVPDAGGVWVVPGFQGLGTPHMDGDARAMIGGLTRSATRAHLARATVEGIAWRCAEVVLALSAAGASPAAIRVDGGAAANDLLLELLASASGIPVERPRWLESAGLGAALLAGRAVGLLGDRDLARLWHPASVFEPAWSDQERYSRLEAWGRCVELARRAGAVP